MAETKNCPVCQSPSEQRYDGRVIVSCPRCGEFIIGRIACQLLQNFTKAQIANLSGWIRENQNCLIAQPDLERLSALSTPTVGEKANKLLAYLAVKHPKPGAVFSFFPRPDEVRMPGNLGLAVCFASVAWVQDDQELAYLIDPYLTQEKHFLQKVNPADFRLTPNGWAYLESLRQGNPASRIGFVAMWFDKSVDPAWAAIEAGIRSSGYESLRVDRKEHNNKIDDEIVAGIRRSKFLVADFTGHRGGVYFETGFATGLGLPVIWLCRQDELEKTHFDTRQYNFIVWEADKLAELSKALQNRIEATIGRGPLTVNALT